MLRVLQRRTSGLNNPKFIALLAIILTALNLRAAVTALPPLIPRIQEALGISATSIGILGMIPTAMFAMSAFTTPWLLRKHSLHAVLISAMVLTASGQILRVLGPSFPVLIAGSIITLFAIGATNALIPIAIRVHFPLRISGLSTTYMFAMQIGMSTAPLFAEPIAAATSWQFSLASWAFLAILGALAWLPLFHTSSRTSPTPNTERQKLAVWRTPVGLGMAIMFGCTSLVTYSLMMFIPRIYVDAGADLQFGATMLAWWSALGLLLAFVGPWVVARFNDPFPIVLVFIALFLIGNAGMAWDAMSAPWLWITLSALGPCSFPIALTLINLRAKTIDGATALSAFGQGAGYTTACIGPLGFGLLYDYTGDWFGPTIFTSTSLLFVALGSWFATRNIHVEDQLPHVISKSTERTSVLAGNSDTTR